MRSILEYIENNDEIMSLINEVLCSDDVPNIEESFLFESAWDNDKLNDEFFPKTFDEVEKLFVVKRDNPWDQELINDNWKIFCHKYLTKCGINEFPKTLFPDNGDWYLANTKGLHASVLINNILIWANAGKLKLYTDYNIEKNTRDNKYEIEYDFNQSLFYNIIALLSKAHYIYREFFNNDSYAWKVKYNDNPSYEEEQKLKTVKKIDLDKLKELENKDKSSKGSSSAEETKDAEEVKDTVEDSIKANKDLLTPLAKEANITGEKLRDIITKVCLNKNGKPRKLDDSVILGLSIMLCGVILTVKKSGKSDNSAILAVTNKIASIVKQKKSIKKSI